MTRSVHSSAAALPGEGEGEGQGEGEGEGEGEPHAKTSSMGARRKKPVRVYSVVGSAHSYVALLVRGRVGVIGVRVIVGRVRLAPNPSPAPSPNSDSNLNPNPNPNPSPSPNLVLLVQFSTGKSGAGYSPDTPVMRPAPPAAAIPPSTWRRGDVREIYARYAGDVREI